MHIGKVLLIAAMVILCLVFLDRLGSRRVGQRNDNVISSKDTVRQVYTAYGQCPESGG